MPPASVPVAQATKPAICRARIEAMDIPVVPMEKVVLLSFFKQVGLARRLDGSLLRYSSFGLVSNASRRTSCLEMYLYRSFLPSILMSVCLGHSTQFTFC